MDLDEVGWISRNLDLEIRSETISRAKTQYRPKLDLSSCRGRHLVIFSARDRPERPTGPLTAPRGARPPLCSWPIWTGKSVFRWLKSTLHYLSRLFPTPPSCKCAGLSPMSPESRPNLSVTGGARGRGRARRFRSRGAAVPIGGSQKNAFMEG